MLLTCFTVLDGSEKQKGDGGWRGFGTMLKNLPKPQEEDTAFKFMQDSIIQNKTQYKPISFITDKVKKMSVFVEYIQILKLPRGINTNAINTNKSNPQSDRSA